MDGGLRGRTGVRVGSGSGCEGLKMGEVGGWELS